jgi:hypothetical protein
MGVVGVATLGFVALVMLAELLWWARSTYKQWRQVQITAALASRFDYGADALQHQRPHQALRDKVALHKTAEELGRKKPKTIER